MLPKCFLFLPGQNKSVFLHTSMANCSFLLNFILCNSCLHVCLSLFLAAGNKGNVLLYLNNQCCAYWTVHINMCSVNAINLNCCVFLVWIGYWNSPEEGGLKFCLPATTNFLQGPPDPLFDHYQPPTTIISNLPLKKLHKSAYLSPNLYSSLKGHRFKCLHMQAT